MPDWAAEPLALVLREATTNVVRHSEARSCTIRVTLDDDGAVLTVANDGARAPTAQADPVGPVPPAPSSGLAGLTARIGAVGGTLVARREGDAFTVTARMPGPPSAPEAPTVPETPTAPARKEEHHD